jgi:hypothetical protein
MYQIFDILIESNIPLPELPEIEAGDASISFQLLGSPPKVKEYNSIHHWRLPDGEITISSARSGEDYILRFPDLADFQIVDDGAAVRCYPCPDVDDVSIRHLLLDQVIPRIIGHNGSIVLHASAVAINGVAAVFLGDTGCGKSTLAASFLINDCPILTDDCLLIRPETSNIIGIYSYVGVRLWEDSIDAIVGKKYEFNEMTHYSSKRRLILHADSTNENDEIPIAAVFLLAPPANAAKTGTIELEKIDGAQIATELIKHSFILDVSDKGKIAEKFSNTGKIAASGFPMYRLNYPRNHALLDQVRTAVEEIVIGKSSQ